MTKEELQEFYKKNKVLAIGVPLILGILLLDMLVLKPGRRKAQTPDPGAAATSAVAETAGAPVRDSLAPPAPLAIPSIPALDPGVEKRFLSVESYPYPATKFIFIPEVPASSPIMQAAEMPAGPEEAPIEPAPDLTYNGFFVMGPDLVAILRLNGRLMLLRGQTRLRDSRFRLEAIHPDRVVISYVDAPEHVFDVPLTDSETRAPDGAADRTQTAKVE